MRGCLLGRANGLKALTSKMHPSDLRCPSKLGQKCPDLEKQPRNSFQLRQLKTASLQNLALKLCDFDFRFQPPLGFATGREFLHMCDLSMSVFFWIPRLFSDHSDVHFLVYLSSLGGGGGGGGSSGPKEPPGFSSEN